MPTEIDILDRELHFARFWFVMFEARTAVLGDILLEADNNVGHSLQGFEAPNSDNHVGEPEPIPMYELRFEHG
jgi:hypothetical protein